MKTSQVNVYDFMSQRTLAVVGVSRSGKKFGNTIYKTLKEKGYRVFPIHPQTDRVEGDVCFRSFSALPEKVGGVVICVPPVQTEIVLRQAYEAGVMRVWMQQGSESYAAMRYCDKNGMSFVHGQCIMMFLEPVDSIHRFHRWIWKLIGKYPSPGAKTAAEAR